MRILHVTPIYEPAWKAGGVVRSTSLLCKALAELGHKGTKRVLLRECKT